MIIIGRVILLVVLQKTCNLNQLGKEPLSCYMLNFSCCQKILSFAFLRNKLEIRAFLGKMKVIKKFRIFNLGTQIIILVYFRTQMIPIFGSKCGDKVF